MARMWILLLLAVATVSGCGGSSNPFDDDEVVDETPDDSGDDGDDGSPISSDRELPPGTGTPEPDASIFRREGQTEDGGGYVTAVSYNSSDDTFIVDGLAFDGDNTYQRSQGATSTFGGYAIYEGAPSYQDSETGAPIEQFLHRAIYGVSDSGQTEFAIVRSGNYAGYGFGGFVYQRNGSVTLPAPSTGQATYSGGYAGVRVFDGRSGIEYTQGDMTASIDFEDFDGSGAVTGKITNRRVFDENGNDITNDITAAMDGTVTSLPVLDLVVAPNALDANGEATGGVISRDPNDGDDYETGTYYAVLSDGADNDLDAEEMVGIVVVTSTDPRDTDVEVQETGGFILYR